MYVRNLYCGVTLLVELYAMATDSKNRPAWWLCMSFISSFRETKIRLSVPLTIALTTVKLSIRSDRISSDKAINAPTSNGKLPIVSIPS